MEEVRELKNVLERVEGKLIAAGSIYGAINFAYWLFVMSLSYVINAVVNLPAVLVGLYWGGAILGGVAVAGRTFRRLINLYMASGRRVRGFPMWRLVVPWGTGAVAGWGIIPAFVSGTPDVRFAVGLLSFIVISLFGQWALVTKDMASVPAFLIPALAIPLARGMGSDAAVLAGFAIATGFALTILLYLHSAFRAIER